MNYTRLVGALSARIEAMSMARETIPVELAFIFVILAFVAGYSFRAVISKVRRAMTGRDRHIDWDIASEDFSHIPTASALPPPRYRPSSGKSPKFKNYAN